MSNTIEPPDDGSAFACMFNERLTCEDNQSQEQNIFKDHRWLLRPKHIFIFSEAGKPIYSLHGDENQLAALMALLQSHISFVDNMCRGDAMRSIVTESGTTIAFLCKGPITLVAVATLGSVVMESVLVLQLEHVYCQLISVITLKRLANIFENDKSFDVRLLTTGSEYLMDHLCRSMVDDSDPSYALSAVRSLPLDCAVRKSISNALVTGCAGVDSLVFGLVISDNRLVTLACKKGHQMHPIDLQLLFTLIASSYSLKHFENWLPICLPNFNCDGFLHAYVSYLSEDHSSCLMLLTVDRDIFHALSKVKDVIVENLSSCDALNVINESRLRSDVVGVADDRTIKHFICKRGDIQFVMSPLTLPPYSDVQHRSRLLQSYAYMYHRMTPSNVYNNLELIFFESENENILAWKVKSYHLLVAFSSITSKADAMMAAHSLLRWVKREHDNLFMKTIAYF